MNQSHMLLKDMILADGRTADILIEDNRISKVAAKLDQPAGAKVIDGRGRLAAVPPFYNMHTHSAMTLLRGYADDMELFKWLNEYIWPAEAKLTGDDIYWGTRLAAQEMIRGGTVFMNDMYWFQKDTARAVEDSGLRAMIGCMFMCDGKGELLARNRVENAELLEKYSDGGRDGRIAINLAPHAVYTVSEKVFRDVAEEAAAKDLYIHLHLAETAKEVADCRAAHGGLTPTAYLDKLGLLGPKTLLAHCVHLTEEDIAILRERKCVLINSTCSNLKLCSGRMPYFEAVTRGGCRLAIGTDGASSSNNLSMFEAAKFTSLVAKERAGDPTVAPAAEVFAIATRGGAEAVGLDAGEIAPGKLADLMLIDLDSPLMIGDYSLISNLVYSADTSVVDTVICNGRVLMEHRVVPGEAEVLAEARKCCRRIAGFRR
ncbi:MAG: amidohydrolase [Victivallaceae bacterium]|nr:amidohydrolase [Victivallaceae bacterium]